MSDSRRTPDAAHGAAPEPDTSIRLRATARARELPGAELTHPFGERWDVYKVAGKVFLLTTEIRGTPVVDLKARPADSVALREEFAAITPGYHMNKRHWISLWPGEGEDGQRLDDGLVDDLVTESYLLVVEKLPRARRPVDSDTFGTGTGSATGV